METVGTVQHPETGINGAPFSPLGPKGQGRLGSYQVPLWLLPTYFPHCSHPHIHIHTHPRLQACQQPPQSLRRIKLYTLAQPSKRFVICPLCHISSFFWDQSPPHFQPCSHSGFLLHPWIHQAYSLPPQDLCICCSLPGILYTHPPNPLVTTHPFGLSANVTYQRNFPKAPLSLYTFRALIPLLQSHYHPRV